MYSVQYPTIYCTVYDMYRVRYVQCTMYNMYSVQCILKPLYIKDIVHCADVSDSAFSAQSVHKMKSICAQSVNYYTSIA